MAFTLPPVFILALVLIAQVNSLSIHGARNMKQVVEEPTSSDSLSHGPAFVDNIDNCLLSCYLCLEGSPYLLDCANNYCMSLGRPRADTLAKVESCPLFKPPADHSTLWMDENIFGGK